MNRTYEIMNIEESYIGFVKDRKAYSLKVGDNGATYNENKALLINVFGEENCTIDNVYNHINCWDDKIGASAEDSGWVVSYSEITHGICNVENTGLSYCNDL